MAINVTQIIRDVKAKLGASIRDLEISDQEIVNLIQTQSLPIFSTFYPLTLPVTVSTTRDRADMAGEYYINTDMELLGIQAVYMQSIRSSGFRNQSHIDGQTSILGQAFAQMGVSAAANITSASQLEYHGFIRPPNKVQIQPLPPSGEQSIVVMCNFTHPTTATLHPGFREVFTKLVLLDVKMDIFGARQFFSSIPTTFGEIDLNLSTFESATDQREELINLFRVKKVHSARKKIWVE